MKQLVLLWVMNKQFEQNTKGVVAPSKGESNKLNRTDHTISALTTFGSGNNNGSRVSIPC